MKVGIKLTDILHHYIGCECVADGNRFILNGVLYDRDTNATIAYTGKFKQHDSVSYPEGYWVENCDFKIVLRSLESITDEEANALWVHCDFNEIYNFYNRRHWLFHFFEGSTIDYRVDMEDSVKIVNWLRTAGFDCDNLIENGLAIKK